MAGRQTRDAGRIFEELLVHGFTVEVVRSRAVHIRRKNPLHTQKHSFFSLSRLVLFARFNSSWDKWFLTTHVDIKSRKMEGLEGNFLLRDVAQNFIGASVPEMKEKSWKGRNSGRETDCGWKSLRKLEFAERETALLECGLIQGRCTYGH